MTSDAARLSELSNAVRESSLKRLRLVPTGRENWRPAEGALSFADIARHLIDCDEWLFRKLVDPRIAAIEAQPGIAVVTDRAEFDALIDRLAVLGGLRGKLIAGLAGGELAALVPDERFGGEVSIWWVIARGNLDHEAHHRGQLAVYLRLVESGWAAPVASRDA